MSEDECQEMLRTATEAHADLSDLALRLYRGGGVWLSRFPALAGRLRTSPLEDRSSLWSLQT